MMWKKLTKVITCNSQKMKDNLLAAYCNIIYNIMPKRRNQDIIYYKGIRIEVNIVKPKIFCHIMEMRT